MLKNSTTVDIEIDQHDLGQRILDCFSQDKHATRDLRSAAMNELNKSGFIDDIGWIGQTPALIRCYVMLPIPAQMIRFDRDFSEEMQEASVFQSKSPVGDETQSIINHREIYHEQ